ncbi:hypothetical protein B0O80DRAFT_490058 [Mortierella sp. GBAus27b]|nr:hypothetical protein B0O80DRAFT_490058 [Mortierella sp. GBAus27b]
MVQGLVAATQASPAAVPGRAPVPHPFTPAFNGDAKNLSFRAYKAKLNGVFQRFPLAFQDESHRITNSEPEEGSHPVNGHAPGSSDLWKTTMTQNKLEVKIPDDYLEFAALFKDKTPGTLPPRRLSDHKIPLQPDAQPPAGRL